MGIRCTLFGHAYAETEVERDREERGDEAVVTIREVQICDRCGDESVVSENKEVTSVADPAPDVTPTSEPEPTPYDATEETAAGAGTDADDVEASARDPETDDGVILDDGEDDEDEEEDEPEGRQYGEWPDADEGHASAESDPVAADDDEPSPWPDAEGDDEGFDANAPTGEEPDVDSPGLADVDAPSDAESSGGNADDGATGVGDRPDDDAELLDTGDDDPGSDAGQQRSQTGGADASDGSSGSGIRRESDAPSPARPGSAGTALHCPSCGYRDDSRDGSLRQGDICPECKKGYLAARD